MWVFLLGFLLGIISVFIVGYLMLFNVFGEKIPSAPFIDQFQPLRIPKELKVFLRSHSEGTFTWESCLSLSLLFHFLFQEHKDSRRFRRWVYKKLQLELNDVTTKYVASRIITGVQIRELSLGTESPVIKNIRVEKFVMSENHELFDEISYEVDVDYQGGFETSIDLNMILGRSAHLSIKVMKLVGKARIVMSRRPFAHWYFAFIEMPQLDFKIDSKFQGHQLKKIIPLITTAFRKAFQRKHVWPNYKIRYRPILLHPLLQPTPPISSFDHVKINGTGLEVTVLQCTRLNSKIFPSDQTYVYCTVSLDQRPFLTNARLDSTHCISVMLTFTRKGASDLIGLSFAKSDAIFKAVKVSDIEVDSTAEKCGFKRGDVLLAINSVPIRNEKQAMRLLSGTAGDLVVLVERDLNYYFEDEIDDANSNTDAFTEEFICISKKDDKRVGVRRGSDASIPSLADSYTQTNDDNNISSRKTSMESKKDEDDVGNLENARFFRTKSTHIPKLSLICPNTDIVRSRSESDLFGDIASGIVSCGSVKDICNSILDEENEADLDNESKDNELVESLSSPASKVTEEALESVLPPKNVGPLGEAREEPYTRVGLPKISSKRERIQQENKERVVSPSLELLVMDKTKKWIGKKRKSPSPFVHRTMDDLTNKTNTGADGNSINSEYAELAGNANDRVSPSLITSRKTKSVPLTKNPLWGQSLHFGLDQKTTKYLNITIHSRRKFDSVSDGIDGGHETPDTSTLLGYASVYIPQIVEDCQLTLSNSHREVFHLRPPSVDSGEIPTEFAELSRRTGFDSRLCYGDVTIGFRFFPQGLPDSTVRAPTPTNDESFRHSFTRTASNSRHEAVLEPADTNNPLQGPTTLEDDVDDEAGNVPKGTFEASKVSHKWTQFHLRHGLYPCGVCHGKIWLKWASRCSVCNFICHNKCLEKANLNEQCVPSLHDFDDNASFVVLDEKELAPSDATSVSSDKDSSTMTRRRRIAATVTERLSSTWKNVGAVAAASRRNTTCTSFENTSSMTSTATAGATDSTAVHRHVECSNLYSSATKSDNKRNGWENTESNHNCSSEITTIDKIVDKDFLACLEGSKNLNELQFEPGNAYNPLIIGTTKETGQRVFGDLSDIAERKSRINEQIDMIQSEIDHINQIRRRLISAIPPDEDMSEELRHYRHSSSLSCERIDAAAVERLDVKREALALLMLHYCSGLSDCHEKEEQNEQSLEEKVDSAALDTSSNNALSDNKEKKMEDVPEDCSEQLTLHGPEHSV